MNRFSIKGFKSMRGMECDAYEFTLLMNGKPVAKVLEPGTGGPMEVDILDASAKPALFHAAHASVVDASKRHADDGLSAFIAEYANMTYEQATADDYTFTTYLSSFLATKADEHESDKRLRRMCRKETVVRLATDKEGQLTVYKKPYSPEFAARLRTKYGADVLEIINERYIEQAQTTEPGIAP